MLVSNVKEFPVTKREAASETDRVMQADADLGYAATIGDFP